MFFVIDIMKGMKKLSFIFIAILLILSLPLTAITAGAAEVSLFSDGAEIDVNGDDDTPESPDELPSYYSSVDLGLTTSIKSQTGDLCWAYSSISTYETLLLKNELFYGYLSVTELDAWGTTREDGSGWQRDALNSGYTYIPIGYYTSWSGPLVLNETAPRYGVTALEYIEQKDIQSIKRSIYEEGSVAANLNYLSPYISNDRNSYLLKEQATSMMGHSVSVVGWDDNYSKDNFDGQHTPENDGAWLCKNSWGNNNSIGGFLWISYEDFYLFNEEFLAPSFGIKSFQRINKTDYLYQNEEYGATYSFGYIDDAVITYFNVFDFAQGGDILDKVIFETTSKGAAYKVYYVPVDGEGVPNADRSLWQELGSGTADYRGYICADFDDVTIKPEKAAIAVEIDASALDGVKNNIGVSEWLRNRDTGKMIFTKTCEAGKSFVTCNGEITDVRDYYQNELNDSIGGTLVIKAVTKGRGDVNLDHIENINDATVIQQYLARIGSLDETQLAVADVNGDGAVNINDATVIQLDLL